MTITPKENLQECIVKHSQFKNPDTLHDLLNAMAIYLLEMQQRITYIPQSKEKKLFDDKPVNCKEFSEIFSIDNKPLIPEARLAMHLGMLKDFLGDAVQQAGPKHHFKIYPKKLLEIAISERFPACEFQKAVRLFLESRGNNDGISKNP